MHKNEQTTDLSASQLAGFKNSISHYSQEKRERLIKEYIKLNDRRKNNLKKFRTLLDKKKSETLRREEGQRAK